MTAMIRATHGNHRRSRLALAALWLFISSGCCRRPDPSDSPAEQPPSGERAVSIEELLSTLGDFELITPEPISTNPELSRLCSGVHAGQLKVAEREHGPHAFARISISMNRLAAEAFGRGADRYPEGAVIVKSKSLGWVWDGTGRRSLQYVASQPADPTDGVGGMIKRHAGYAPQSGNWEYFYFERKGAIEHGLIQSCIQCHREMKSSDYVFGTWDKPHEDGY